MAHSHAEAADGHEASVRIAALSLAVTGSLLALKFTLGLVSDSIAVLGDAVDSATDLTGGAAALLAVRIAAQPADEAHPYGHGKIESLSAAVAATIIGLGGGLIVFQSVRRLAGEQPEIDVGVGLAAMLIAAAANAAVGYLMRRQAERSGSMALRAESTHLFTNVVQALAIIAGLALVGLTGEEVFDPLVALGLAAYMGWTAVGLVRVALADIMDTALPAEEIEVIRAVLRAHEADVRGFHRLRTRRSGATRHVDMHVSVDPHLTIEQCHEISERLERDIEARLPGTVLVIHLEPHAGGRQDVDLVIEERAR
jgi:cation diffusion facilitator family transporter